MHIPTFIVALFGVGMMLVCLTKIEMVDASAFPFGFYPTVGPFIDTCQGLSATQCRTNKLCTWSTAKFPQCVLTSRVGVRPPDMWKSETMDLVSKFFTVQFGMHLTDGKTDRRYYNVEVNECAALCLKSAAGLSDWLPELTPGANITSSRRRCLSFDFFPFEMPMALPPQSESMTRGVCVLNADTRNTARLRTEDSSFTDAELFYISQAALRPFSRLDGYYEVRDNRGSGMTNTLDFGTDQTSLGSGDVEPAWGQSRYGMSYLKEPDPRSAGLDCTDQSGSNRVNDQDVSKTFFGGFTPTTRDGSCPGMVTKSVAGSMCNDAGGSLCPTQTVVRQLDGDKLGCNLDGQSIWADEDEETNPFLKKFVRCCASYVDPPDCWLYNKNNVDFCTIKTTSNDCIGLGSGFADQLDKGFGRLLTDYRNRCANAVSLGIIPNCRQLLMQPWKARDRCVWCPGPNGGGQCRPGGNFGICPVADDNIRQGFAVQVKAYCPQAQLCDLAARKGLGDLAPLFNPSTGVSSTTTTPTPKPTAAVPVNTAGGSIGGCGGGVGGVPCRAIRGVGARYKCKQRNDCVWDRAKGTVFSTCHSS